MLAGNSFDERSCCTLVLSFIGMRFLQGALTQIGAGRLKRARLEALMQMLTQRLSLLFEFAPPDFYERSTFASYIDNLVETGILREDADGWLHQDDRSRAWERSMERLLPADAVLAIRRVAADHADTDLPPASPPAPRRHWRRKLRM